MARRLAAGVRVEQRQPPGVVRPTVAGRLPALLLMVPHDADRSDDPEHGRAACRASHHPRHVGMRLTLGRVLLSSAQLRLREQPGRLGAWRGEVAGGVIELEDLEAVEDGVV
uniref:Uncharacterized protein n=1 Tax=Zea mays TaxID=4577 RepID=A0A804QKJ9_MAIZE